MKRTLSGLISVVILVAVFCLFNISTANAAPIVLKFQSAYPKTSGQGHNYAYFAKKVDEHSNGEVEVKVFWPNQLVKTQEAFSAVQRGMIEGYAGVLTYFSGIMPEGNGEFLPFGWENPDQAVDIYLNFGYLDVMREALARHGLYGITSVSASSHGLITKFPVNKVEDLKGKKIRAAGVQAEYILMLGGTPVSLPPTDQYMALQRGTIDGILYPWYTVEDYKFYEVASYICLPAPYHPCIADIVMNAKVWDKLSPDHKKAINRAGREAMLYSFQYGKENDKRAVEDMKARGVKTTTLAPEELKRFKEAARKVRELHAKKSDLCAKQVEIVENYLKEKGR